MIKVSDKYIVCIDITGEDESTIMVISDLNGHLVVTNHIHGKEAEDLYEKLTNKSLERGNENEQVNFSKKSC